MSITSVAHHKVHMKIIIVLAIMLALALVGFTWMQTDQVIAPPSVRVLDWLWKSVHLSMSCLGKHEVFLRKQMESFVKETTFQNTAKSTRGNTLENGGSVN
jgi:hypothetical protein